MRPESSSSLSSLLLLSSSLLSTSSRRRSCDAERDPGRRRVAVQPERDPRQDDDEARRDVDLDDVVAETAHEVELARQPRVITYSGVTRRHTQPVTADLQTHVGVVFDADVGLSF